MNWKAPLIILVCCYSCTKNNVESTTSIAQATKDSTTIWIQTAKNNKELSKFNRLQLLNKAALLVHKYPSNATKTASLSQLALVYKRLGDSLSFRLKNTELINLSKKIGDYKSHGEAHWDLALFLKKSQPDSAIYHYKEAYNLFLKADLGSTSITYPGRMLYAMALIKENNKDYVGAEKDIVKTIKFYTENNITDRLFDAYNVLAISQSDLGKHNKALEYHKKAKEFIPYVKENQRYKLYTTNINNIASTNLRKGDYPDAITHYINLLNIDNLVQKNPKLYAIAISGLTYAEFRNGETDFKKLSSRYLKSNRILDSLDNKIYKARNHEYYAELLASDNKIDLAIENALKAKSIAQETSNNDRLLSSLKLLTTLDKKNSAQYAEAYFNLNESLQKQERAIQDKFARIGLETDQLIEEKESLAKKNNQLLGISLIMLLLGIGAFVIINQRVINQKLKFQQSQQESNQEIYNLMLSQQGKFQEGKQLEQKRISEEMHDGILGQILGIRLILSGLNDRNDESAITQRAELIEKLQGLEEEIRTISHELNNAAYKKIDNFISAVKDLIHTVSVSSEIKILFDYTEAFDWDDLIGDIKINAYRITQECLQNCVKHAKCNLITVNLYQIHKEIILEITDNGIGYTKKEKKGIGLKNITSRVNKINGHLNIKSELKKGTTIKLTIPTIVISKK